jgi:hypothetical protein
MKAASKSYPMAVEQNGVIIGIVDAPDWGEEIGEKPSRVDLLEAAALARAFADQLEAAAVEDT